MRKNQTFVYLINNKYRFSNIIKGILNKIIFFKINYV